MTRVQTTEKHYVTFVSPGTFVSETSEKPIAAWDTTAAVAMAETVRERYGARPYGFYFITYAEADPVSDRQGRKLRVQAEETARSPFHFLGGTIETLDDVEARNDPKEDILRTNMKYGSPIVVVNTNSYRSVQSFEENHVIVDAAGVIVERGDDPKWVAYRAEVERRTSEA